MLIRYKKWLDIEVNNTYFNESICSVVNLVPFDTTKIILHNHDIRILKQSNLISFYLEVSKKTESEVTSEISGLGSLYFQLCIEDNLFPGYTEIPNLDHDKFLYFKNDQNSKSFQKSASVSKKDLVNVLNECIGVLSFDPKLIYPSADEAPKLSLDFKAREVFWEYQIVIPENWNMDDLKMEIQGVGHQAYKEQSGIKQIVGGQKVKVFTSIEKHQLQQNLIDNSLLKIWYSDNFSNRIRDLDVKLPNPGIENLYKNKSKVNDDSFYSTTIVYV